MILFGGDGPLFFNYDRAHTCSKTWIWHVLFLNNIIPWTEVDGCMTWTWYIASEV